LQITKGFQLLMNVVAVVPFNSPQPDFAEGLRPISPRWPNTNVASTLLDFAS
jgi:hypothetical protein